MLFAYLSSRLDVSGYLAYIQQPFILLNISLHLVSYLCLSIYLSMDPFICISIYISIYNPLSIYSSSYYLSIYLSQSIYAHTILYIPFYIYSRGVFFLYLPIWFEHLPPPLLLPSPTYPSKVQHNTKAVFAPVNDPVFLSVRSSVRVSVFFYSVCLNLSLNRSPTDVFIYIYFMYIYLSNYALSIPLLLIQNFWLQFGQGLWQTL